MRASVVSYKEGKKNKTKDLSGEMETQVQSQAVMGVQ